MKDTSIGKIFNPTVITVGPDTSVFRTVSVMQANSISCIIVAEAQRPVGIFTERDFLMAVSSDTHPDHRPVSDYMTSPVISVALDSNIYEVYGMLEEHGIRHMAVVDEQGLLAGIITQSDIMRSLGVEYFIEVKSISKIMTRNVVTVAPDFPVGKAVSKMARYAISCIVVEENGHPIGIMTERDIVGLFSTGEENKAAEIREVMSAPVLTLKSSSNVHDAALAMSARNIRRLVIVDDSGIIVGMVTQHDIVRQIENRYIEFLKEIIRNKEDALKKTRKILDEKMILESILKSPTDLAIVALGPDLRVRYHNPAADGIFNFTEADPDSHTGPGPRQWFGIRGFDLREAAAAVLSGGPCTSVHEQTDSANPRFIETALSGIWDDRHGLAGYLLLGQDVTDRRKMEEEALKARKLESIGLLAGGISHDFNNLLTGILNCISITKSYLPDGEKSWESLDMAEKAARLAKELTMELSTLAKIGEPARKEMSVASILMESTGLFRKDFLVDFEFSIPEDLRTVAIDEGQITRVIHNIVLNALEAMPQGGSVRISAENLYLPKGQLTLKEGSYIRISVRDQGTGIPKEDLPRIFDPYYTTKQRGNKKGTGLGLTVCYSIVKNHNGSIEVESEPGAGTAFHIYLPACQPGSADSGR